MRRVAALGDIHLDHDKAILRLFDHGGVMKGGFVEFPAGGAPGRIEIDDDRPLLPCSLLENVI